MRIDASEPVVLEAYEVKESAFSDFGMSLRTNLEVKSGGSVAWMRVSAIDQGSSAARTNIRVRDRILAIDGKLVTELDRAEMLALFFQRQKGEMSRLLVLSPTEALPRFVTVVSNRPGP